MHAEIFVYKSHENNLEFRVNTYIESFFHVAVRNAKELFKFSVFSGKLERANQFSRTYFHTWRVC